MLSEILNALIETILIVSISGVLTILFGVLLNLLIYAQCNPKKRIFRLLGSLANSITEAYNFTPFIAIMILFIPLLSKITDVTNILYAIIPITLFTTPLFTAQVFKALKQMPDDLTEIYANYSNSKLKVLTKLYIPECKPKIISSATKSLVQIVGYSTLAGVVGAGGLGKVIYEKGFINLNIDYMIIATIILFLFSKLIFIYGNMLVAKSSKT